MSTAIQVTTLPIRKVNVRQDLLAIADLIEICFANTLDDDGRDYLRHLRWAARDLSYLTWLQSAAERITSPLYGFVWEENNRIVGNLSLIPLNRQGRLVYLIANVAVHPDYRQRGIGHQLTQTALEHLKRRGIDTAWLQVRDDNPVAYRLYRSLGFVERARRTTWNSASRPSLGFLSPDGISVYHRRAADWELQSAWLHDIYPADIAWNLPINFARINPHAVNRFFLWLRGEFQENWVARKSETPLGFATWEPSRSSTDAIWLATAEDENEVPAIQALLAYARSAVAGRGRGLSVNFPAGRADEAFVRAGFYHHQTLIWMTADLTRQ